MKGRTPLDGVCARSGFELVIVTWLITKARDLPNNELNSLSLDKRSGSSTDDAFQQTKDKVKQEVLTA